MEATPGRTPGLEPGGVVRVRSRRWLVEHVSEPTQAWESALVRLSCVEDDALGERAEVLWDHELDARVEDTEKAWDLAARRGYDEPRIFSAYLNTLRWNCVTATDPKLFQAPYRAGIQVKAYQLEPLRKALLMPRVNLFIADDVGLGKTIEAGLILRELILRQKVRRVLVCCPPSVVTQWRDEMEQRFGLTFAIYDREFVARTRQERGYAVNPWTTHSRFVISQALVRDEKYANDLAVWLAAALARSSSNGFCSSTGGLRNGSCGKRATQGRAATVCPRLRGGPRIVDASIEGRSNVVPGAWTRRTSCPALPRTRRACSTT